MEAHPCTTAVDLRYRIDDGEVRVRASYPETWGGEPEPDHRSFDSRGGEEDGFPGVGSCIGRLGMVLVKGRSYCGIVESHVICTHVQGWPTAVIGAITTVSTSATTVFIRVD